jgi:hypothetical protein
MKSPKIILTITLLLFILSEKIIGQIIIDSSCIHSKIYTLASTEMQGREAGTIGADKAKEYIINYLKSINVSNITNVQNVPLTHVYNGKSYIYNKKDTIKEYVDFYLVQANKNRKLKPIEIENKKIIELEYLSDWQKKLKKYKNKWVLFSFNNKKDKKIDELIKLTPTLQQNGILGLIISIPIETNNSYISESKKTYLTKDLEYDDFPILLINNESWYRFFKLNKNLTFVNKNTQFKTGYNIYTIFPGVKSNEQTTILSAHYDHLGYNNRGVFYGADDNASGTAALLCIANQYALLQNTPQQNESDVVIAWWTAEEKGLLGSRYFTENLPFKASNINAVINVDMIGRYDTEYNPPSKYTYVIGSNFINNKLHESNEFVNKNGQNLILDYKYNTIDHPEDLFERSDQFNFHQIGIPSIFFFSGLHSDYHTINDTPDKIDAKKASSIATHIFQLSYYLSQLNNQINK